MSRRVESMLMARVDAARNLARTPGKGHEAQGRMFLAKRCHEAAKAGTIDPSVVQAVLDDLLVGLDPSAHEGARSEATYIVQQLGHG